MAQVASARLHKPSQPSNKRSEELGETPMGIRTSQWGYQVRLSIAEMLYSESRLGPFSKGSFPWLVRFMTVRPHDSTLPTGLPQIFRSILNP